jgi:hypothetical protein
LLLLTEVAVRKLRFGRKIRVPERAAAPSLSRLRAARDRARRTVTESAPSRIEPAKVANPTAATLSPTPETSEERPDTPEEAPATHTARLLSVKRRHRR